MSGQNLFGQATQIVQGAATQLTALFTENLMTGSIADLQKTRELLNDVNNVLAGTARTSPVRGKSPKRSGSQAKIEVIEREGDLLRIKIGSRPGLVFLPSLVDLFDVIAQNPGIQAPHPKMKNQLTKGGFYELSAFAQGIGLVMKGSTGGFYLGDPVKIQEFRDEYMSPVTVMAEGPSNGQEVA